MERAVADQPPPVPNARPAVWDLVVADMLAVPVRLLEGRACVRCGVGRYASGRCSSCGLEVATFARVLRRVQGAA